MDKVNLKKIATPREMGLAALVVFALVFLFFNLFYSPKSGEIDQLKTRMKAVQKERDELKKQTDALAKLKNRQKAAPVQVMDKTSNFRLQTAKGQRAPKLRKISEVIGSVTSTAERNGLLMDSLTTQASFARPGYQRTPLILKTQGPFGQVTSFLEELDRMDALLSVDSINLEKSESSSNEMALDMSATFYQLEGIHVPEKIE